MANLPYCCCVTILVYCSVRDWTRICYVIRLEDIRLHASTHYQICCGFIISTLGRGFKSIWICCRICQMRVDGSRIPFYGKKKLQIQKYLDMCRQGLRQMALHCVWLRNVLAEMLLFWKCLIMDIKNFITAQFLDTAEVNDPNMTSYTNHSVKFGICAWQCVKRTPDCRLQTNHNLDQILTTN